MSLAGKPPFATEVPDSFFENQPKVVPQPKKQHVDQTAPGGARESAYTTFDSYFTGNGPDVRASGAGDIGRGLMNAESDYDDDSSDDEHPTDEKQPSPINTHPADKHQALFAAATGAPPPRAMSPQTQQEHFPNPQQSEQMQQPQMPPTNQLRIVKQPQPVVHNRGNDWLLSHHGEPSTPPANETRSMVQEQRAPPLALQSGIRAPAPAHPRPPQALFMQDQPMPPRLPFAGSPVPTTRTPQPLPPPPTPIMPVFARPRKDESSVKFEDDKVEILRGNSEETLLPRGRGGKGDDFWRRFSMVAKEEAKTGSKSAWLKKTESGSTRLSAWVWIVGLVILLAIGGGIGLGWYFTHNKPATQPLAIGGSANEVFTTSEKQVSTAAAAASVKATRVTAAPVPTNTSNNNERRAEELVSAPALTTVTPLPSSHRRSLVSRLSH